MTTRSRTVFDDLELVGLLRDDPELLALADALVETVRRPRRTTARLRRTGAAAVALAALAVVLGLLAVSPWSGAPTLAERALAAVGDAPVLHVAVEQPGEPLHDLRTGEEVPRTLRTEIWFDEERALKRTVTTLDGEVLDELLETGAGGWTRSGPVYTCAWIAGHPVEATKAGVSCDPNGDNGTEPRRVPERPPTLDSALSELADGYRSALASGAAEEVGRGRVDGRSVVWLRFPTARDVERVAVDADTFAPVALEREGAAAPIPVVVAETVPRDDALFRRPEPAPAQIGGGIAAAAEMEPEQASRVLDEAVWLGREWNGLSLVSVERQERIVREGPDGPGEVVPLVKLTYASATPDGSVDRASRVEIYEARACLIRVGWSCSPRDPGSAGLLGAPFGLDGPISIGLLRRDGLYVSIWRGGSAPPLLEIARSLQPLPAPRG